MEKLKNKQNNACVICLVEFEVQDALILLKKCQHLFHKECIKQWLTERTEDCPTCRAKVKMPEQWKK